MSSYCGGRKIVHKSLSKFLTLVLLFAFFMSCGSKQETETTDQTQIEPQAVDISDLNILTDEEKAEGWILLFDGENFDGWRGLGREEIPEGHWSSKMAL